MGLYWYTMRKQTKVVDGTVAWMKGFIKSDVELARFAYAYKDFGMASSWGVPAAWKRLAGRAHAAADRAFEANPDVEYYIMGDSFKEAAEQHYPVFKMKEKMGAFLEETSDPVVGYLNKVGRGKYNIVWGGEPYEHAG